MVEKALEIARGYKQHPAFENYMAGFRDYYEEVFKLLPQSAKTLELGCAYGILALMLKLRGDMVITSDMTTEYTNLKMLRDNGILFVKNNIEKQDLKHKFNLITMTEVIEHLNSNPLPAVKRLHNALHEGGRLFVSTVMKEAHGDTTSMNSGKKGLWNELDDWHDIPEYKGKWMDEHTFHYDQWNLITLLTEAGFEIEKVGNINNFSHYIIGKK